MCSDFFFKQLWYHIFLVVVLSRLVSHKRFFDFLLRLLCTENCPEKTVDIALLSIPDDSWVQHSAGSLALVD